jgi:hypothetical protein
MMRKGLSKGVDTFRLDRPLKQLFDLLEEMLSLDSHTLFEPFELYPTDSNPWSTFLDCAS